MPTSAPKSQGKERLAIDPRVIMLLKNWLSASESQICSLEVLCNQIPEVHTLLETSMCDISERFVAMAADFERYSEYAKESIGTYDTHNLSVLEEVLATFKDNPNPAAQEKIEALITSSKKEEEKTKQSVKVISESTASINNTISSIIVDMQFQDRVSQNLVIVVNVLNAIIAYLQDEINETTESFDEYNERADLDRDFAQKLLKLLTLGELQHKFMDHLLTHKYISSFAELGYDPNAHPEQKKDDDNIDLF